MHSYHSGIALCKHLAHSDASAAETPPSLPDMFVFWDWEIEFEVGVTQTKLLCITAVLMQENCHAMSFQAELRHTSNLTDAMKQAQVRHFPLLPSL